MKVAIISSCYGAYDMPHLATQQETEHEVDYVMVTDADLQWMGSGPTWREFGWRVVTEPRPHVHPNVAAKLAKFHPDLYVEPDTLVTVWVDAGAEFGPGLVNHVLARFMDPGTSGDMQSLQGGATSLVTALMFPHPHRSHLRDEVEVSRTLRKYHALPMEAQIEHYFAKGYPDERIWATGCIARLAFNPTNIMHGDQWLQEVVRWGFQDQLSHGYCAWACDLEVAPLGESLFTSPHIRFADHTHKP